MNNVQLALTLLVSVLATSDGATLPHRDASMRREVAALTAKGNTMMQTNRSVVRATTKRYAVQATINRIKTPVHEIITHLALGLSGIITNKIKKFDHSDVVPYLRGVFWNDDPYGDLFDHNDQPSEEFNMNLGMNWGGSFQACDLGFPSGLLCRAHFGDLQLLHGMASNNCECPEVVRERMLLWAEFSWNVALGLFKPCNSLGPLRVGDGIIFFDRFELGRFGGFEKHTKVGRIWLSPKNSADLCGCLKRSEANEREPRIKRSNWWTKRCKKHKNMDYVGRRRHHCKCKTHFVQVRRRNQRCQNCEYKNTQYTSNVQKRAAGSLLHMIQDSFAKGHTTRVNYDCIFTEEASNDPSGRWYLREHQGNQNCGAIRSFNNYRIQDSGKHAKYDELKGETPQNGRYSSYSNINRTPGAVEALFASAAVLEKMKDGEQWEETKPFFEGNIWRLDSPRLPAGKGMGEDPPDSCDKCPA